MLNKKIIWLLLLLTVFGSSPANAFFSIQKRVGLNYSSEPTDTGENPYYHYETASGNPEARYYNPLIRRFVNSDPARDAWNWFAYANGNPVSYVDPTGFVANLANGGGGGIGSGLLDLGQTGIGIVGLVPAFGNAADLINVGISAARGNYVDAAIDGTSAIPGAGQVAGFGAIVNRGGRGIGKIVDGVMSLFRKSDVVSKIPKPKGIPDDYVIKPSKKGGGTQYVNPNNPHDRVRAMPGNPKSPNPSQQTPYVKRQVDGKFLDKDGNVVPGDSPEAHIPFDQFNF